MKFEKARIHFLSDAFGLLSSRNLLPWQRDVTTSLYSTIGFGSIKSYTNLLNILGSQPQRKHSYWQDILLRKNALQGGYSHCDVL